MQRVHRRNNLIVVDPRWGSRSSTRRSTPDGGITAALVEALVLSLGPALRLASVFEHAPVGVAILRGGSHVFEFANQGYLATIGDRRVAGLPIREALPDLAGQGIFANLLTNAAKYTDPEGTIRVDGGRDGAEVVVRVTDTGSGIAPEMLPRIFDLFMQERQDLERAQGGLGIGLAIVRSLVEAHGGTVAASSDGKGRGSTFTLRMPAYAGAETREPLAAMPRAPRGEGGRILLVDDNRDAADLRADSLRPLGHTLRVAHDGPTALMAVQASRRRLRCWTWDFR